MAFKQSTPRGSGTPYSFIVYRSGNNTDPIRRALLARGGWDAVDSEDIKRDASWTANFVWKPTWTNPKPCPGGWVRGHANVAKRQCYNHLRAVEPLCTKDSLFETMLAYYRAIGEDSLKHLPPTYLIEPRAKEGVEAWPGWKEFEEHFNRCALDSECKNLWLVKPTSLNRGIGIEVFRTIEEISSFLKDKARQASMGIQPVWVLQKYIENPMLFEDRKFDFRVWVLVTDSGDVYMHAPGYVRTSSERFDLSSTDRFAHLTNYCQQVNASSFGMYEEGNTLTFVDLETYLTNVTLPKLRAKHASTPTETETASSDAAAAEDTSGKKRKSVDKPIHLAANGEEAMWGCGRNGLWGQMRSAVIDAFEALRGRGGVRAQGFEENGFAKKPPTWIPMAPKPASKAEPTFPPDHGSSVSSGSARGSAGYPCGTAAGAVGSSGTRHRFELLGLDFIADDDLQLYFIEVNTNPSLSYQNAWHEKFVDAMAVRMLNLVFDGVFPDPPAPTDGLYTTSSPGTWRPQESWQFLMNVYNASWKLPASASTIVESLVKPKVAVVSEPAATSRSRTPSAVRPTAPLTASYTERRTLRDPSPMGEGEDVPKHSISRRIPASPIVSKAKGPSRQVAVTSIITLMPMSLGAESTVIREFKPPAAAGRFGITSVVTKEKDPDSPQRITVAKSTVHPHPGFIGAHRSMSQMVERAPDYIPLSATMLPPRVSVSSKGLHSPSRIARPGSSPRIAHADKLVMSPIRVPPAK